MTDIDIEAIEKRANAATKGPWHHSPWHIEEADPAVRCAEGWIVATASKDDDSNFIAHARTDIPALIAEVRRLRVENEDAMRGRREATQTIIDAIGSVGPESIEDAERRIADEVVRLRAKVAAGDRLAEAVEAAGERDDRGVLACVPALLAYREVKP